MMQQNEGGDDRRYGVARTAGDGATGAAWAIAALLASSLLWGVSWYPFRRLAAAGVDGVMAIIVTELAATALCLVLFRRQIFQRPVVSRAAVALLVIGLTGGITNTGFILATLEGNVLRATLLLYLAPLWTLFLARWLLDEPIEASGVGVVLLALGGAVVMLGPAALAGGLGRGDGLGLAAGIAYAGYNVAVRRADRIPQAQKTLAAALGSAVMAVVAIPFVGSSGWPVALPVSTWALIFGTALLLVLVVTLMQYGLMRVTATRAIVILVSELVFAAGSAWWLADEVPGAREFAGGALIICASLISAGVGRSKIASPQ